MRVMILAGVAAAFFGLADRQQAWAQMSPYGRPGQFGPMVRPPTLSPYLNLLNNNGNNAAVNYYMQVLPEFRRRDVERQLGTAILDLERRSTSTGTTTEVEDLFPTLTGTGHPAGFMTFSPYYNMSGGISRPAPRPTATPRGGR